MPSFVTLHSLAEVGFRACIDNDREFTPKHMAKNTKRHNCNGHHHQQLSNDYSSREVMTPWRVECLLSSACKFLDRLKFWMGCKLDNSNARFISITANKTLEPKEDDSHEIVKMQQRTFYFMRMLHEDKKHQNSAATNWTVYYKRRRYIILITNVYLKLYHIKYSQQAPGLLTS